MSAYAVSAATAPVYHQPKKPFEAFSQTLIEKFGTVGKDVFVPYCRAILEGCQIVDWKQEKDGNYRLVLKNAYEMARSDRGGKSWVIEKELLMQFVPENNQIIFPNVKKLYDQGIAIDPSNKSLNAMWASETYLWVCYTGVGYSLRWDSEQGRLISDNINDAPSVIQSLATPRVKTLEEEYKHWAERPAKEV